MDSPDYDNNSATHAGSSSPAKKSANAETISFSEHHPPESNVNAKLENPLAGIPQQQLMADGAAFAEAHNLGHLKDLFSKAALVAQDPLGYENIPLLTAEDKEALRMEVTHKWKQPKVLYYLVVLCSRM
jgi:hypothetical protein